MALVKQKHLNLYSRYTKDIITDLGIPVTIVNATVTSQCPNCFYDRVHKTSSGRYNKTGPKPFTSGICPVCKGKGELTISTEKTINCTVNWAKHTSADEFEGSSGGTIEANNFQIKTLVENYLLIKNADSITIDGVKTRLLSIIKRGLKENIVCVAICERDD